MKKILIQLDTDEFASTFDRVVAVDADVDELFSYSNVRPDVVEGLVHGAIFTRGVPDLGRTAIFIGGSHVAAGEELFRRVQSIFFGPMRVSVMMDSNGSNTTAAAAVLAAARHLKLSQTTAVILGGTGPVGQRAAELLALQGARVKLASRSIERAQSVCDQLRKSLPESDLTPIDWPNSAAGAQWNHEVQLVIAAGAAGIELLTQDTWTGIKSLRVVIDLNAVPPAGIGGVDVMDKAVDRDGVICYGAIGVGGTKMKIHKAAIRRLFESNQQILDTRTIFELGQTLEAK